MEGEGKEEGEGREEGEGKEEGEGREEREWEKLKEKEEGKREEDEGVGERSEGGKLFFTSCNCSFRTTGSRCCTRDWLAPGCST